MKRYMIDGEKCVLAKVDTDNKVDEHTFEVSPPAPPPPPIQRQRPRTCAGSDQRDDM